MEFEIECENLTKSFENFRAVDQVTLQIPAGEIFGFLGPNGAGKTTTIRLLMGMLVPTDGFAKIHGMDCLKDRIELKRWIGYLPDFPTFHDYLRGIEILNFVGQMQGLKKNELKEKTAELFEKLDLKEAADEFAVNYSAGMKRKLALACAQIHDPQIFLLDEPTNELDPIASREVQNWILSSAHSGKTIFLSTHLLEQAEKLCHRVGILHNGKLLAIGTPGELEEHLCPGGSLEEVFFSVTNTSLHG
ncbi:MAG: ABC transporter ATP-binding protein [Candidatus Eremiobacteraeota bacterium]|nr:ABC transporter ATP-binding protein [Candidatus Eremiobacteraeota bacterium]MCL5055279.1 ABC transporter ATP-binding protein [Bacillota bacterium]